MLGATGNPDGPGLYNAAKGIMVSSICPKVYTEIGSFVILNRGQMTKPVNRGFKSY
jgi:hypothetical protein